MSKILYVGNLPYTITVGELKDLFTKFSLNLREKNYDSEAGSGGLCQTLVPCKSRIPVNSDITWNPSIKRRSICGVMS